MGRKEIASDKLAFSMGKSARKAMVKSINKVTKSKKLIKELSRVNRITVI